MAITLQEVIANRLVDEDILDCLPHQCPTCGAEIEFSDSLKQIMCPNRYCPDKVAARLEAMATEMKVDGWGFATCREVVMRFGMKSPYQVYLLEGKECSGVATFQKKVNGFLNSPKRRCELWEMVKYGGFPNLAATAYKIFGRYNTVDEAYEGIETYQVPYIAELLGLKSSEAGVMAVNIYNTLMEFKSEIQFGETKFDIQNKQGVAIYIAITGGVTGYTNKAEYVDMLNRRFAGKLNIMLMNSVTSAVHFLVADHDTASNKYKKALRVQEKGGSIVITDSEQLPNYLEQLANSL